MSEHAKYGATTARVASSSTGGATTARGSSSSTGGATTARGSSSSTGGATTARGSSSSGTGGATTTPARRATSRTAGPLVAPPQPPPPPSGRGWRNLCFLLGTICAIQTWRGCHRPSITTDAAAAHDKSDTAEHRALDHDASTTANTPAGRSPATAAGEPAGVRFHGFVVPSWATWFAPHPGEPLRDYRDRILPLAEQAIAPQRARVAQQRDRFAAAANLRPQQLADLDRTTQDTASALEERVLGAFLNGEVDPATFKPMAGVDLARDMVDIVSRGNQHFLDSLDPSQQATLAKQPFDFADYLACSTKWEDALGML